MACYLGSNLIMPQLHITADKRKIRDFPNCLRQLLLSAKRYMKDGAKSDHPWPQKIHNS
jgi:hypothetical protein